MLWYFQLPATSFSKAANNAPLPSSPGIRTSVGLSPPMQAAMRSAHRRSRLRPLVRIEQEQIVPPVAGGQDHPFGQAEAHLARGQVGDEDHVAADQLLRLAVGGADAGEDLARA